MHKILIEFDDETFRVTPTKNLTPVEVIGVLDIAKDAVKANRSKNTEEQTTTEQK